MEGRKKKTLHIKQATVRVSAELHFAPLFDYTCEDVFPFDFVLHCTIQLHLVEPHTTVAFSHVILFWAKYDNNKHMKG